MNPYFINEPAVLSFSGGRTSAYMLVQILEAHSGILPDYVKVLFANTGVEFEATYKFIHDCERELSVPIVWLEYSGKKSFKIVDYETASRDGTPFDKLTTDKKYLPNPIARFCTIELKILTIQRYMESIGMSEFETIVGIRADEPRRVAKMKAKEGYLVPLAVANVKVEDIRDFWDAMPWNLEMQMNPNGSSPGSNCTLCFLKGAGIKQSLIRENKNLADWWIKQEDKIGATFRKDQPSYREMRDYGDDQANLFDDESLSCFCGD